MSAPVSASVDLEYRRSALVDASCARSYEAITDLGELLAHVPELEDVRVTRNGDEASAMLVIGPGLLDLRLATEVSLHTTPGLNLVDIVADVRAIGLHTGLSLDLDCSDRDQTLVQCSAVLSCAHRQARWLRRPLMASLERNVDVFLTEVCARIGHNARAQRVFEHLSG